MKVAQPPKPWSMENLGLTSSVRFTHPYGRELLWVDGQWWAGLTDLLRPVRGVPAAKSMIEARAAGCAWLHKLESD